MQLDLSRVVVLDYESHFSNEYSLRSKELNTSEYIRDERFVAHCVGIKEYHQPTRVVWYDDIQPALDALDLQNKFVLAHNCAFDGLILSEHFGIVPALYLDTLSMARALHGGFTRLSLDVLAKYYGFKNKMPNVLNKMKGHRRIPEELIADATAYTATDVDICYLLFLKMIAVFPERQVQLVDWTIRQFADPVLYVDVPRAQRELEREVERKRLLIEKIGLDEEELQSAGKFAAQLRKLGVEPPMKISPRTELPTFAFSQQDDEFMALGVHPDERVRDLIAARLGVKSTIGESRAQRFINVGEKPLPVGYGFAAAHTLRWGGTNKMNMQNLPNEERDDNNVPIPLTGELRKSVIAPPGYVIVVCDSSQIEPRLLAELAGQEDLLHVFRTGGDPYCALGPTVYGKIITKADIDERKVCKAAVLGLGYYMGALRFQSTLALGILGPKMDVTLDFAEHVKNAWRRKNFMITAFWRDMGMILYGMLMKRFSNQMDVCTTYKIFEYDGRTIWLPNGMGLHYNDLQAKWDDDRERWYDYTYKSNNEVHRIHPGILTENLIQACGNMVIGEQLLQINNRYRAVLTTHDEIGALARTEEADDCLAFMIKTMSTPPAWLPNVPLGAEGGYARNYSK